MEELNYAIDAYLEEHTIAELLEIVLDKIEWKEKEYIEQIKKQ